MTSTKYEKASWSSRNTYEDTLRTQRSPCISIGIIEAFGLSEISDGSPTSPSVHILIGTSTISTFPAKRRNGDHYSWEDKYNIDIQPDQSLVITLVSNATCLGCFKIEFSRLEELEKKTDLWLKLKYPIRSQSLSTWSEDNPVTVTNQMLGSAKDKCPRLHLQLQYMTADAMNRITVRVESYRTVVDRENYTEYNVKVTRQDGISWKVRLQFSDVYELREKIINVLPSLSDIEFPGKCRFNWLSFVWPKLSQFDEGLIRRRQKCMEEFLNATLDRMSEFSYNRLEEMLRTK